ncbi:hypothetical protein E9840_03350 [Tissierella creatinini]|nr:hypothetical protein E9840_03350 [Tissierella creatinini]TJX60144.1 hypothetical protein E8P77_20415 [Soehngenia saccharolytica]
MKRICYVVIVILIITVALGCSNLNKNDTEKVAQKFIKDIHTVDDMKVVEYRKLEGLIPPEANILGNGVPKLSITEANEEYTEILDSLDQNIQGLMTEKGYERVVSNRFNLITTRICAENDYNSLVTNLTLAEDLYEDDKDIDKVRYFYKATLKFISSDGLKEEEGLIKGNIELIEEDGQLKVSLYTITEYPKLTY